MTFWDFAHKNIDTIAQLILVLGFFAVLIVYAILHRR